MKFRSRSFILLAAVALVFFAGASIYVNAQFGAVDLAGEVLAGERSAAEGITVHERDVLYSRVEFSASYDAGSGESRSDGGLISGYDGSVPVTWGDPALGAEAVRLTSGVLTWEGPEPDFDAFEPWEREIYSDIVSSFPGEEGSFSGRAVLIHKGRITGDVSMSELEERGESLIDYVKSAWNYRADRISRAITELGEED